MPEREGGKTRMKPYLIPPPVDLVTEGKKSALDRGSSFKALVAEALEELLKERGGKRPKD
jgi:hypothetical protein